jgi:hypothetical protein
MTKLQLMKYFPAAAAALITLVAMPALHPSSVRAAGGTYQPVENWAQLPAGTAWGVMSWVATDARGNVYAFQRD